MFFSLQFACVTTMTLSRIVAAVFICYLLWQGVPEYAAIVFGAAALLDFDGYFARLWKVATPFGAILDPVADKILVMATIFGLIIWGNLWSAWFILPTTIIILRESFMMGVPLWRLTKAWMCEGKSAIETLFTFTDEQPTTRPPVTDAGKVKMVIQCVAVFILIGVESTIDYESEWIPLIGEGLWWFGTGLYWISGYYTFVTGLDYLGKTFPTIKPGISSVMSVIWVPKGL